MNAGMDRLEIQTGRDSLLLSWLESAPRGASPSVAPVRSHPSATHSRPASEPAASPLLQSPVLSLRDLTPPGAAVSPAPSSVVMPAPPGSLSISGIFPMPAAVPAAALRFGDIDVTVTTASAPLPFSAPVSEPRVVVAQPSTPAPGMSTPIPAAVQVRPQPVRSLHRSAKTPGAPIAPPLPASAPATAGTFHTARGFRTPALTNRFAAFAVADHDEDESGSTSSSSSPAASPTRGARHVPGLPASRPPPVAPLVPAVPLPATFSVPAVPMVADDFSLDHGVGSASPLQTVTHRHLHRGHDPLPPGAPGAAGGSPPSSSSSSSSSTLRPRRLVLMPSSPRLLGATVVVAIAVAVALMALRRALVPLLRLLPCCRLPTAVTIGSPLSTPARLPLRLPRLPGMASLAVQPISGLRVFALPWNG
ncbi:hypothetical protein HDU96_004573 [Phlyctochytrium bullatum]|nr:hypothetical protein HDU96_004573 [Phlyctochytrium bullatum]